MAGFRLEASKRQCTARGVVTVLLVLAAISKVDAQSAPGDFELRGAVTGHGSLEVVVFVPEHTNGTLGMCNGTLSGPLNERYFTCDDHGGKSSKQTFKGLLPDTEYNCTVTFTILLADGEATVATKSISLRTKPELPVPDSNATTGSNRSANDAGVVFSSTPVMVILCTSALFVAATLSQPLL